MCYRKAKDLVCLFCFVHAAPLHLRSLRSAPFWALWGVQGIEVPADVEAIYAARAKKGGNAAPVQRCPTSFTHPPVPFRAMCCSGGSGSSRV